MSTLKNKVLKRLKELQVSAKSVLLKNNFGKMIENVRKGDNNFFTRIRTHFTKKLRTTAMLIHNEKILKAKQPKQLPRPQALKDEDTRLKKLKNELSQMFQNLFNDFDNITFTVATDDQKKVLKQVVAKRETNYNSIKEIKPPITMKNIDYAHQAIRKVCAEKYVAEDIQKWDSLYSKDHAEEEPLNAMQLAMQIERLEAQRELRKAGMSDENIETTLVELDQNHSKKLGTSFLNSEEKEELKQNMNKTNITTPKPPK